MWKEEEAVSSIHRAGHVVYQAPVTAADNQAPSFLYAQPPVYAGRDLTVTLTSTLLVSFPTAYAGREPGASELLLQHTKP